MSKKNIINIESQWEDLTISQLRKTVQQYFKENLKGVTVVNDETRIPISITVSSAKKTAFGEAMYHKKAEVIRVLPLLLKSAHYNNFGQRKPLDSPEILGYLNFKNKCYIDGKLEHVRIAVRFQKGGKFYYNVEVNMIK